MSIKRRVKAGTSKAAAAARKAKFKTAYLANGGNATEAAKAAGYSAKTAYSSGGRLLKDVEFATQLRQAAEDAGKIAGLNLDRTLREVARLAYSDPRKLYRKDGSLIPIHELDDDTAATIASVEVDEEYGKESEEELEPQPHGGALERKRATGEVIGRTKKVKLWDKNAALEKAMKYHGLYEKDNRQRGESLLLKVAFGRED